MAGQVLSPLDFPDSPLAQACRQPLMLGLFLPIQSGGWSPSTLPRGTDWRYPYNARLTQQAEALGFELAFGLAQWVGEGGHGGQTRFREQSLDPFVTTAALVAQTQRILLISTMHVLYGPWHPLHLAKFGATLDHISGGRWGLNLVTGHMPYEAAMFGMQRAEHDSRYAMATEFADILETLWHSRYNTSFDGRFWKLENALATPAPAYGRPIMVNATGSAAGIEYAARYSDIVFTPSPGGTQFDEAIPALPAHTRRIHDAALKLGRRVKVLINPTIICRPTDGEAQRYYQAIIDAADDGAVDGFIARNALSDAQGWKRGRAREHRVIGGNLVLVGSPERIADNLLALHRAGCDGVQLSFYDYEPDLTYFGEAVLPLLHERGLRL